MSKKRGKKGFTLVELSLAVGFIGLLSLTITLIINDTVATYRRGLTLNQINTTGMDLVDDLRSAIQNSPARGPAFECESMYSGSNSELTTQAGACYQDGNSSLVHLEKWANVELEPERNPGAVESMPVYGAICTGAFSYIWNSGYFFGENAGAAKANTSSGSGPKIQGVDMAEFVYNGGRITNFRLLKIKDEKRGVCKSAVWKASGSYGSLSAYHGSEYYKSLPKIEFDASGSEGATQGYVDYFKGFDPDIDSEKILDDAATNQLALYDFTISNPVTTSDGEASFYSVSFILGTLTGGINVKKTGNFCKTPEDYDQDFDYCAINKFNFAAQAKGG